MPNTVKKNEFDNAIFVIAKEKWKNSESWFDEAQMECADINKYHFCTYNSFLKHYYVYSYLNFESFTIPFLDIISQMSTYLSIDLRTKDGALFMSIY